MLFSGFFIISRHFLHKIQENYLNLLTFYPIIDIYISFLLGLCLKGKKCPLALSESFSRKGRRMLVGIKIFAKQLFAAAMIVFGVANLVFDFGEGPAMTLAALACASTMLNSARLDMNEAKPRINITITREEDNSSKG